MSIEKREPPEVLNRIENFLENFDITVSAFELRHGCFVQTFGKKMELEILGPDGFKTAVELDLEIDPMIRQARLELIAHLKRKLNLAKHEIEYLTVRIRDLEKEANG
jgi:hypothetical protein